MPRMSVKQKPMTRAKAKRQKAQSDPDRKTRRCLMCGRDFESSWAGERICRRCKSTAAWKAG